MSALGTLKTSSTIETAVIDRLRAWMPSYIADVERQNDLEPGSAASIKSIRAVSDPNDSARRPEDQLPAVLVAVSSTSEKPKKDADGYYSAPYTLGVMVVTATNSEQNSRHLGQLYGAAIRGCLVQSRSLSSDVQMTDWEGEDLGLIDPEDNRSLFGCTNTFSCELRDIVSWKMGPPPTWEPPETPVEATPPTDPTEEITGSWPATSIEETIDLVGANE